MSHSPHNAAEIAKIEHELEILRSRYAIFSYWAVVVKWFCIVAAVIIVALLVLMAVTRDPVMALLLTFVVVLFPLAFCLSLKDLRWIDVISPGPPWGRGSLGRQSEARIVEEMVAEREARLKQLRSSQT